MDSSSVWAEQCRLPEYDIDPQWLFEELQDEFPSLAAPASYPEFAEVKAQADAYSKAIFHSWHTLNHILCRREAVIRRRWCKKSKDQRQKILLLASPDIPLRHRPDHQIMIRLIERGFCRCCNRIKPSVSHEVKMRHEASLKCPHINLEDLVEGNSLLLLLNCRGHNLPHVFAHTDLKACTLGRFSSNIPIAYLHGYTMYLAGQITQEDYGKLVHWEDETVNFGSVGQTLQFQPGLGLLVLDQQSRILDFLVNCCRQILRDVLEEDLLSDQVPVQKEPLPALPGDGTSYAQLSLIMAEAPYRLPTKLNTQHIAALVEARKMSAEDHVWEMREDPGYFASLLQEHHDHRIEILLDISGKSHPKINDNDSWDRTLSSAVVDAHEDLILWHRLHRHTCALDSLLGLAQGNLNPQKRLTEKYEKTLAFLYNTLDRLCRIACQRFLIAFSCSHPKRTCFVRTPHKAAYNGGVEVVQKGEFEPLLAWTSYLSRVEGPSAGSLHSIVDEMQHYLDKDPSKKKLFTPFVARTFSDLALITYIADQIDNFYPWAPFFVHKRAKQVKESKHPAANVEALTNVLKECKSFDVRSLVTPLTKKFHYPVEKAYSSAQVDAMQKAEANLDEVWKNLESFFAARYPHSLENIFKTHYNSEKREIRRTPDYVSTNHTLIDSGDKSTAELPPPANEIGPSQTHDEPAGSRNTVLRTKVKTRGTPGVLREVSSSQQRSRQVLNDGHNAKARNADMESILSGLSRRAKKVIATLFHVHSTSDQRGEIIWRDFLHTMVCLRFKVEKLYGSVWQFTPTIGSVKRCVHVHEPHPSGKIPYHMARSIGRRLVRVYDWPGDVFDFA